MPAPEPEPIIEPEPVVVEPEVDVTEQARERAAVAGLLPFAQDLAALRTNDTLDRLDQSGDITGAVEGEAPVVERSLITSRAGSGSAGINTAELSRGTGGQGLAGRATTQIESPIESFGPAGGEVERAGASDLRSRSREEIELVFDRNKGAIFALYNRALRQNPALVGKVVLELTIEPDGRVSDCIVVSSELGDPELERRLLQRVLLFQFEAKDVERITTTKPIDFFPA
ncbi:MAG: TonB family protein [Gammaproteobacteria bacterium]|nr:TonB family protein [Gammaproteobacteria bacterium]